MRRKLKETPDPEHITVSRLVDPSGRIPIRSPEAATVARWFGLGISQKRAEESSANIRWNPLPPVAAGAITLITGPSGAGKSALLGALRRRLGAARPWINLGAFQFEDMPIVNCFGDLDLRQTLRLLGRVGLGEAWSYLRTPGELSDGQHFRLRLAAGLHRARAAGDRPILACDEFAAVLDRLTARVVSRCLRRAIDQMPDVSAVVATSHDDLQPALAPEVIVRCDFAKFEMSGGCAE